jgi:hypothetical protein
MIKLVRRHDLKPPPRIRLTDSGEPSPMLWQRRPENKSAYAVFQPTVPLDPEKATFIILPRIDTTQLIQPEIDQVRRAWGSDNLVVMANCDEAPYWWRDESSGTEFDLFDTPHIQQILATIERLDHQGLEDIYLIGQSQSGGLLSAALGFSLYQVIRAFNRQYDPACPQEIMDGLVKTHRVLATLSKVKGLVILNGVPTIRDSRFPQREIANAIVQRRPFFGVLLWAATVRIPLREETVQARRDKQEAYIARLALLHKIEQSFDRLSVDFNHAVLSAFARDTKLPKYLRNAFPTDVRLIYHKKDHIARSSAADTMWYGFWLSLVGNRHTDYQASSRQFHTSIQTKDFVGWLRDYMVLMHARGRR